ncbi:MAG: hypothetical protein IB618_00525 [Candidatus Pacearchaeota archaeon]|nr:MAG: hypothetical protein IB618_00525 [Candidatus Pacearchaeota archaeon]
MEKYKEIKYHIEVEHEPGTFDDDMDLLLQNPTEAYQQLQIIKQKYKGHKIMITKITKTTNYSPLTESDLEKLAQNL